MPGQQAQDINDPKETHVLRVLPGRMFSALQLICIIYAGFERIEPGMNLAQEHEIAKWLRAFAFRHDKLGAAGHKFHS